MTKMDLIMLKVLKEGLTIELSKETTEDHAYYGPGWSDLKTTLKYKGKEICSDKIRLEELKSD